MLKTERYQEYGWSLIRLIESWKDRHPENSLVDPYLLANEILSSGVIQKYLDEKHSKPYGVP